MKKILFFSVATLLSVNVAKSQANIAAARSAAILSNVTVKGVVINGQELGYGIRYIQDNTGGIAVYSSGSFTAVNRGDSIQVNGPLTDYSALLEISTTTLGNPTPVTFTALGTGVIQTPSVITVPQFAEPVEGRLLKFTNCTIGTTTLSTFGHKTNYVCTCPTGTMTIRTFSFSNLFGTTVPTGSVDIVGVGSQYCFAGGACTTGYQLLPRDLNDITPHTVGIKEENNSSVNLSVYPNPTTHKINFTLANNEIVKSTQITDITGKVVYTSKENTNSVDVANLTNGIYNITVVTQNRSYKSKFSVSK